MLQIFNYNAGKGDCIRIRFAGNSGKIHNVLIDSGVTRFGNQLSGIFRKTKSANERIDAALISHADEDHLGGLLWNLRNSGELPVNEIWMNHGKLMGNNTDLSVRQNDEVYTRAFKAGIPVKPAVRGNVYEMDGAIFKIIWPNSNETAAFCHEPESTPLSHQSDWGYALKELMDMPLKVKDNSYSNYLSVIMEFQYAGKKYLFTGDAWSEQILMSIESEKYEMVKLPHHGSARNISEDWKDKIACKNFMICTDGNGHPDKQTLAKLLKWYDEVNIYCSVNWWSSRLFFGEDKQYSSKLLFKDGEESEWN